MTAIQVLRAGMTVLLVLLAIAAIQDADALRKVRQDNGQQRSSATPTPRAETPAPAPIPGATDRAGGSAVIRAVPLVDADKLV